ncbi:HAD family hydrolase [Sphingomonas morindae]|uniref:HAD family hydrolase n=1 Tax=Sphingomonas morindae TaxID=1541170 RepID=A0ABY4XE42_9SPHN|nr:HAD family hydrolase [Sphingomonas morindae]USI75241.1 HAD family hydrolase [Sphingomonas morindae]
MTWTHPHFRTPAEQAGYEAVDAELADRIPRRDHVPEGERDGWRQNMLPFGERWSGIRELEACLAFREPSDPESAVVADALVRAGTVTDDLYDRLLAVADRRYTEHLHYPSPPITRAVAFDAFGTLVRIGKRHRPYERLVARARQRAAELPSPMTAAIGLDDYAAMLGLSPPHVERIGLEEELASVTPYPDALETLRRVKAHGVTVVVASNLAEPYAAPLKALLGDWVDVWHFSFAVGATKPQRFFYAALTARLGIEPHELLMVGDSWHADVEGAVKAGARAQWLDRTGRAAYVRRHVAVRSLADVGWILRTAHPGEPAQA